jgi:hypothetical protein
MPKGISSMEWSKTQTGSTALGIQVCCNRHDINIVHIDFEGNRHYADISDSGLFETEEDQ